MAGGTEARAHFGRYETLFRFASGGMAEVYAARALGEAGFQKIVALKRMRPELADDPRFVTMFLDEGRLAANIASPNVVSTLDLGRADDNSLYLVMELVTGVPLSQLIESTRAGGSRIPLALGVDILAQAANGLHDAHEARSPTGEPLEIVHRDCSPHNILVDVQGQVRITDFGIAKAMERQTQSHAGEMKGKLSYLSPEQARGLAVDRRTDIFILGVVAFEVLTGQMLFDAEHAVAALHKVASMPIPRVDGVCPEIPASVADVVARALLRGPDERYATAAAFGDALVNALPGKLPSRSELATFVRRLGGADLSQVENRIRDTLVSEREGSVRPPALLDALRAPALPRPPAVPRFDTVPPGIDATDPDVRSLAEREDASRTDVGVARTVEVPFTRVGDPALARPPSFRPRARVATLPLGSEPPPAREEREDATSPPRSRTEILPSQPPPADARPLPPPVEARPARSPVALVAAALLVLATITGGLAAWIATRPDATAPRATPRSAPHAADPARTLPADARDPARAAPSIADAPRNTTTLVDGVTAGDPPVDEPVDGAPEVLEPVDAPRGRRGVRTPSKRTTPTTGPAGGRRSGPSTVAGDPATPGGDRAATFGEIPW